MAITYPRSLPAGIEWARTPFTLNRTVLGTPLNDGDLPRIETGIPWWRGEWESVTINLDEIAAVEAWFASLRGGMKTFIAHDQKKEFPNAYKSGIGGVTRAGGGSFDGTFTTHALFTNEIRISNGPASTAWIAGDYIALTEGAKRGLFKITEDHTASGAGFSILQVEPYVPTNIFTTAAVANCVKPSCEFVIEADSFQADPGKHFGEVSFSARQKVLS